MPKAREELAELVAIRSVADARLFPPEDVARVQRNGWPTVAGVGFDDARLIETPDGSSAVIGSRPCGDPAAPTVLLYAHYDVQPPQDEEAWRTPPFQLTEVGGRWYGRGAADCKGPERWRPLCRPPMADRPSSWVREARSPLCSVLSATYPRAEIILIGVEEPLTAIHAPNESVSPAEIADMALAEALFLQDYS